jgi:hypothetical protein
MLWNLPTQVGLALRSPRLLASLAVFAAAGVGAASYSRRRNRPSPEELERERRNTLAAIGRIVDGSITETQWISGFPEVTPHTQIYRYRIAGVTYECAQDVSPLSELVRDLRIDLPVQVRFDPRNPGDSIVVSETWSGLRIDHVNPIPPVSIPSDQ